MALQKSKNDNNSTKYSYSQLYEDIKNREEQEMYNLYTQNPCFIQCFAKAMIEAQKMISKQFPGVDVTIYGRIKSEDSFKVKDNQKLGNVYDMYAFKIVVNNVPKSYTNSSPLILQAKAMLDVIDAKIDSVNKRIALNSNSEDLHQLLNELLEQRSTFEDQLNVAVSQNIANALTASNSDFLKNLGAKNLVDRIKDYDKENGYKASQRTIEAHPDSNVNFPCYVELQLRSELRDAMARGNHSDFKHSKYTDSSCGDFPKEEFDNCKTEEDFNLLCKKIPQYLVLRNGEVYILSKCSNILQAHIDYFLATSESEDGKLCYVHKDDLEKLKDLSKFDKEHRSQKIQVDQGIETSRENGKKKVNQLDEEYER